MPRGKRKVVHKPKENDSKRRSRRTSKAHTSPGPSVIASLEIARQYETPQVSSRKKRKVQTKPPPLPKQVDKVDDEEETSTEDEVEEDEYIDPTTPKNPNSEEENSETEDDYVEQKLPKKKGKQSKTTGSSIGQTKQKTNRTKSAEAPLKSPVDVDNRYGTTKERTCPHCKRILSSLHGLAYHLKHQVCRRAEGGDAHYRIPAEVQNAIIETKGTKVPFLPIRTGVKFVVPIYGVVQVVGDDRAPMDFGRTLVTQKDRASAHKLNARMNKVHSKARKKRRLLQIQRMRGSGESKFMTVNSEQFQHLLFQKAHLRRIYEEQNSHVTSKSLSAHHYFSSSAILMRGLNANTLPTKKKQVDVGVDRSVPPDSYPERIVECVLIQDVRPRITHLDDEEHDEVNLMKANNARKAVRQERNAAKRKKSNLGIPNEPVADSSIRCYIQRKLLTELYSPDIPLFICETCGKHYDSVVGFKAHVDSRACIREWEYAEEEFNNREGMAAEINASKKLVAKRKNPSAKESDVASLKSAQSTTKADSIILSSPKAKNEEEEEEEQYLPPAAKALFHVEYDKAHPSRRPQPPPMAVATISTFDPKTSAMYPSVLLTLGPLLNIAGAKSEGTTMTRRKRRGVDFTKIHMDVTDSKDESNQDAPAVVLKAKPEKAKRISNRQGLFQPKVCEDITHVIKEIDSGRFPSLTRFYGTHSDECCVPYCKSTSTLYCCEFCSNVSHVDCLERKVVVKNLDVNGDFMCHVCLRTILSRLARHDRRLRKKKELEKKQKYLFVPKPVHPPKTVNPLKFDPTKTCVYPEVYMSLGYLRKGAKVSILPKSLKQRARLKAKIDPFITSANRQNFEASEDGHESDCCKSDRDDMDDDEALYLKVVIKPDALQTPTNQVLVETQIKSKAMVYPPPLALPQPVTHKPSVIIDTVVLAEEIHTGRYPSMNRYEGSHDSKCIVCKTGGGGTDALNQLYMCEFCSNAEHMPCLKSRVAIQDIDPEYDDFMCHKCVQTVVARRVRAEGRRLEKRSEALEKAGIANNPFYSANSSLPATSAVNIQKDVEWSDRDFESHDVSFEPCPFGGLGGLVCCAHCTDVYSRFLADTTVEMESQMLARDGREVSEMLELLEDAKMRLQQSVELSEANDIRRRLLSYT